MAISEASTCWDGTNSILDCDETSSYSIHTPSSSSTRSSVSGSFSTSEFNEPLHTIPTAQPVPTGLTPLICSRNPCLDLQAKDRLTEILRNYILYRCSLNDHCNEADFDDTALDALNRMSFLQALQTVEHFSASVSPRIQKRSAYLMGILRGQEAHWDKFLVTQGTMAHNQQRNSFVPLNGKQILNMPAQLLLMIGQCCLQGNCLPSDFTPEVCLSLHHLPMALALKSVSAFNSNKRIVAGCKGGVINRARFFLRLIQNVAEQNLPAHHFNAQYLPQHTFHKQAPNNLHTSFTQQQIHPRSKSVYCERNINSLSRQFSDSVILGNSKTVNQSSHTELGPIGSSPKSFLAANARTESTRENLDLNLEELAELDFSLDKTVQRESKVEQLQHEVQLRVQREQKLLQELTETKQRLCALQSECVKLRGLLSVN